MLALVHVELAEANAFVALHHRHHKPVAGHRFSVGVRDGENIVGVAICGRPVARACDKAATVEVVRLCTDGTKNACSFLYSACARAARELGYRLIQTYVLETEPATSLTASGWTLAAITRGGKWKHTDGKARRDDQPTCKKQRW